MNIVILGAGISGLSLAWFLQKKHGDRANITILEKEPRVGGWIETIHKEGFLFDTGPKSCRTFGNGVETLKLVQELGILDQVILPPLSATKRYLYKGSCLHKVPSCPFTFLLSPLSSGLWKSLYKEWNAPKGSCEDESIYNFVLRRMGATIAETFFDPLVLGIYAGDIRKLSIQACFPAMYEWEQKYGSLLKGALADRKKRKQEEVEPFIASLQKSPLFSFRQGMETLPKTLARKCKATILLSNPALSLSKTEEGMKIVLADRILHADWVYSTLPLSSLSALIPIQLREIVATSVVSVSMGYHLPVLKKKGFGYLVPSQEKEDILGMVWDSSIFQEQNQSLQETRLTVMIGGEKGKDIACLSQEEIQCIARDAARNHLGIQTPPDAIQSKLADKAIPQYYVGHKERVAAVKMQLAREYPRLKVLGTSFDSVSVNDCIASSLAMSDA